MTCFLLASTPGLERGRTREDVVAREISRRREFSLADISNSPLGDSLRLGKTHPRQFAISFRGGATDLVARKRNESVVEAYRGLIRALVREYFSCHFALHFSSAWSEASADREPFEISASESVERFPLTNSETVYRVLS